MDPELQIKIFGYVDEMEPVPNSYKARIFELVEKGLTEKQIEQLAASDQRRRSTIQSQLINPITERIASQN